SAHGDRAALPGAKAAFRRSAQRVLSLGQGAVSMRLLRIPYLVDLIRTDVPAEIRAYGADKRLDRDFTMRGPLLNRLLTRKLRTVLTLHGLPLPTVAPQTDPERVRSHAELSARLAAAVGVFDEATLAGLARAVRGHSDAPVLEHAVQQTVG